MNDMSQIFLFQGMNEDKIAEYTDHCPVLQYSPSDVIHSSSEPLKGIGYLVSGNAKIVSGNGETLLRILRPGDIFGAASVFSLNAANRTVVVAYGACRIRLIPEDIINKVITDDPKAARRYIAFLSERISFLNAKISNLTAGDTVAKTAGFLLSLETDDEGNFILNDSYINVASRLNMGRASLYRTIDRFIADELISRDRDKLKLLNREGLEDIILKKDPGNFRQRKD